MRADPYLDFDELSEPARWFLNGDLLSELDEEYRRKNQQFRAFVRKQTATTTHPLHFLADKTAGKLFDAGHVVPVKHLAKRGTKLERLVVEDRASNRSKQATKITGIVNVQGVPVDCASVVAWATANPALATYAAQCKAGTSTSRGWSSITGKVLPAELELEFVLSLPDVVWVHKTASAPSLRREALFG